MLNSTSIFLVHATILTFFSEIICIHLPSVPLIVLILLLLIFSHRFHTGWKTVANLLLLIQSSKAVASTYALSWCLGNECFLCCTIINFLVEQIYPRYL